MYEKEYNKFVFKFINNGKLDILKFLGRCDCAGLGEIAKGVSSYSAKVGFHLNGNRQHKPSLVEMGLVEKFILDDTFFVRYRVTGFGKHIYSAFVEVNKSE